MSGNGFGDADTSPAHWLYISEFTPGAPHSLQEDVSLHALAGMLVTKEAARSRGHWHTVADLPAPRHSGATAAEPEELPWETP